MSYYRTPIGIGYAVNSDHEGVAIRTIDGCSWWSWNDVEPISKAQAISEMGRT